MRNLLVFLISFLVFVIPAYAYPQVEFDDCLSSAKENPDLVDIDDESIKGFCDCALTQIFEENKIDNLWMNACIRKNF